MTKSRAMMHRTWESCSKRIGQNRAWRLSARAGLERASEGGFEPPVGRGSGGSAGGAEVGIRGRLPRSLAAREGCRYGGAARRRPVRGLQKRRLARISLVN